MPVEGDGEGEEACKACLTGDQQPPRRDENLFPGPVAPENAVIGPEPERRANRRDAGQDAKRSDAADAAIAAVAGEEDITAAQVARRNKTAPRRDPHGCGDARIGPGPRRPEPADIEEVLPHAGSLCPSQRPDCRKAAKARLT